MGRLIAMLLLVGGPALGDPAENGHGQAVVPLRTIKPGEVISTADLRVTLSEAEGALTSPEEAAGLVARRLLVAGRPVRAGDVGPPVLVRRNSHVPLVFTRGGLAIRTEGRAMSDGGEGDRVRVMNLASRQIVSGVVRPDGTVATGDRE
jgi:flagella basal body P-ring formation protein FlgA